MTKAQEKAVERAAKIIVKKFWHRAHQGQAWLPNLHLCTQIAITLQKAGLLHGVRGGKVVIPKQCPAHGGRGHTDGFNAGWDACRDEVLKRLNAKKGAKRG